MTADSRPVGIFDSGVGGLTVVRSVREHLPGESIVYLGDSARAPYGPRSLEEIRTFARQIAGELVARDVKALVVACNSVEVAAIAELAEEEAIPLVGVIEPAVRAAVGVAVATGAERIGVIGTEATIASQAYDWALARTGTGLELISMACPAFVGYIEAGDTDGPELRAAAEESLAGMREEQVGALILGCTHYPLIAPLISEVVGEEVVLISSAEGTAEELERVLDQRGLRAPEGAPSGLTVLCTGDPARFQAAADAFLGREVADVHRVDLAAAEA